jgi:mRNA interferase RelE/StbE
MEFQLIFAPSVEKDFSKLPKEISRRIFKKCQETKTNPMSYWKKITDRNDYKLKVGDYRAIADINFESKTIEITKAGHRKHVYKQLR